MQRKSFVIALTALCLALTGPVRADMSLDPAKPDLVIDGVPLPGDVAPLDRVPSEVPVDRRYAGTWVGAWGGDLKTILVIESVETDGTVTLVYDGTVTLVYAVGDHALWQIRRGWWRFGGRIEDKRLRIKGRITEITYELAP